MQILKAKDTTSEVAQRSFCSRARTGVSAGLISAAFLVGAPAAAFAQTTTDPNAAYTQGSTDAAKAGFSSLTGTLTSVLVPALFGLVVMGIVIALAMKYMKKGAKQA